MSEFARFYEVNQINKDQDYFSASSGSGVVENCADYDRTTKWESIGSDDTTTETIEIQFRDPDLSNENRTVDTFVITGCNAKLFRVYTSYWNGSSYDAWVLKDTISNSSINNHIIEFTAVSCGRVKIEMDTTITADEEKEITEFVATSLIWEATMPFDVFDIKNSQKSVIRRLYSGTGQKVHHYDKWSATLEFRQITSTEKDKLREIYDLHTSFIVILEPYDDADNYYKPEEFYRVLWQTPWNEKYFTRVKSAGYNVKLKLEEV